MMESREIGTTLHAWTFAEYASYERSRRWYMVAAAVALLLFAYAFFTRNFLFAVILVMVALILYLRQVRAPAEHACTITDRGVQVGDRFYAYDDLKEFWVVDDAGPTGTLYLHTKRTRPYLAIPITDATANAVRTTLRAHLIENTEEDEVFSDAAARALKL